MKENESRPTRSLRFTLPRLLVIGTLVLIAFPSYWGARNYVGYCGEARLSDSERIQAAIARYMNSALQVAADNDMRPYYKYSSVEEFIELNKDCCSIADETPVGESVSKLDRLFGLGISFVKIHFRRRFVVQAGNIEEGPFVTFYVNVTNCGRAWN